MWSWKSVWSWIRGTDEVGEVGVGVGVGVGGVGIGFHR